MTDTTGTPAEQDENRLAFLRYLPRRIEAFERRILRYRFDGWEPSGMAVLSGDLQRLAEASERHGLDETRHHLLALAHAVVEHIASMRAPDMQQTARLFGMLSAVSKSLPPAGATAPHATAPANAAVTAVQLAMAEVAQVESTPAPGIESTAAADASAVDAPETAHDIVPIEPAAMTDAAGLADQAEVAASAAPIEPEATVDSVESVEPDEPGEPGEPGEPVEPVEPVAATESSEPAEPVSVSLTAGSPKPAEHESVATAAATEAAEPTDQIEQSAASASIDAPEPVESIVLVEAPVSDEPPLAAEDFAPADTIAIAEPAEVVAQAAQETLAAASAESIEPDLPDDADTTSEGGVRRVYHLSDGNAFALELDQHLESEGYAIEPVDSLDELSEMMMCLVPQVLLVDASHMSELAAIGNLRRDVQKRSQPPRRIQMVALSAQVNLETRRLAHRAGVDLLMFPPLDIAGISERLRILHATAAEEKARVLIVEDNRADALYAQTVLANAGMHAQVEHDPMRVLETLKAVRPDLVLMDLHMPFANGVEVTMLIREHPVFARLPIVFLSGESDPDSQLEAINAGGDDFLFKPIRPRHLIDAVRDRMRRLHPVSRQGPAPDDPMGVELQA